MELSGGVGDGDGVVVGEQAEGFAAAFKGEGCGYPRQRWQRGCLFAAVAVRVRPAVSLLAVLVAAPGAGLVDEVGDAVGLVGAEAASLAWFRHGRGYVERVG